MSGVTQTIRRQHFRDAYRAERPIPSAALKNSPTAMLEGVLYSLVITIGLVAGVIALTPPDLIKQIPILHAAVAFFVPFTTLFVVTELPSIRIAKAMLKGFVLALVVGGTTILTLAVAGHSAADSDKPTVTRTAANFG